MKPAVRARIACGNGKLKNSHFHTRARDLMYIHVGTFHERERASLSAPIKMRHIIRLSWFGKQK